MARINTLTETDATDPAVGTIPTLEQVDPATLLVDLNVRNDLSLDPDFLASIATDGVLVPIVAVRTLDGQLRVRYGHRRVAAAIEAQRPTVPVVVTADERTDDAEQIKRLVGQWSENERRAALTPAERVGVIAQLSAFGISQNQITRRTRAKRSEVKAALAVSKSPIAAGALDRWGQDFLTLEYAAALAEVEDNDDDVTALIAAAKTGQFEHTAQRIRDRRKADAERQVREDELRAVGLTVIAPPAHDDQTCALTVLANADGEPLTAAAHRDCPGHVAYLRETWGWIDHATGLPPETTDEDQAEDQAEDQHRRKLVHGTYLETRYACTDPDGHGHRDRFSQSTSTNSSTPRRVADMSEPEQEAARAARRDVIESNKAWTSAEQVRRRYLEQLATRKTPPKGTAAYLTAVLTSDRRVLADQNGRELAAALLGVTAPNYGDDLGDYQGLLDNATEQRAQVVALTIALAAAEAHTDRNDWRSHRKATTRYLRYLESVGYTLSPVERRACGDPVTPDEITGEAAA